MLDRLQQEWKEGTNRFDQAGEILLLAIQNQQVVGVCGLNRDPYTDNDRVGRVRRLYVSVDSRRRGIGRLLVTEIQTTARVCSINCACVLTLRKPMPFIVAWVSIVLKTILNVPICERYVSESICSVTRHYRMFSNAY